MGRAVCLEGATAAAQREKKPRVCHWPGSVRKEINCANRQAASFLLQAAGTEVLGGRASLRPKQEGAV